MIYIKIKNPIEITPFKLAEWILFWKDEDSDAVDKLGDVLARGFKGSRVCKKLSPKANVPISFDELQRSIEIAGKYETKLWKVMQKFNTYMKDFNYVKVSGYDVWNADETLINMIHPILVKYDKERNGSPSVDDIDVPESLRNGLEDSNDDKVHEKWDWVVAEMLHAFNPDNYSYDVDYLPKSEVDRVNNGRMLFGKYMTALWT